MTQSEFWLFAAVLAQAALTAMLYFALIQVRFAVASDKAALKPEMAYDQSAWPPHARKVSNAVISQFELPVLFYVGALFAFQFDAANPVTAGLAWAFVVLRIVHAIIHTGPNVVMHRFAVFLAGFATLIVFWTFLAAHAFGAL